MPKYDYRCSAGHQYEKREGFDAPAVQECQVCGIEARRVLTPPAIVFKGSGWYVNDSRKGASAASTETPGTAPTADGAGASDTSTETKSETKTETKTDSKPASSAPPAAAASE